MEGLIDYAGLFPPAQLELDPAIHNFAQYGKVEDAWILGRFIIPVSRLFELEAYQSLFTDREPFSFSVLGHPALQMDVFEASKRTVADASAFEARHDGHAIADRFEIKLQPHYLELSELVDLLALYHRGFSEKLATPTRAFFESPLMGEGWQAGIEKTIRAISDANSAARDEVFGLKFRCGGVTADLFPDVEAVAFALLMCRDAEIPFKATAGLHHPVRHFSDSVDAMMHGFLNVFGGAILARLHSFDSSTMIRVLADEQTKHFSATDEGFSWMEWSATAEEITEARANYATSFGSCSFEEPREDLVELGWMAASASQEN